MSFSRTLQGPFVLNNKFWATPSFLIDLTFFLATTRSPVSDSLMVFHLLCSSLCLSLLLDTKDLNSFLCLNRSGDVASKLSNAFCYSGVPSLDLAGDKSIVNGNYLPIATTDQ